MADRWNEWVPVARWEITRMIKRKDFLISTLLIPVLVVGGILLMTWFKGRDEKKVTRIAVVRADGAPVVLAPRDRFEWVTPVEGERDREGLLALVNGKKVDGALVMPPSLAGADSIEVIVRWPAPGWKGALREHLHAQARTERGAALGLNDASLAALDAEVALRERVTQAAARTSRADRAIATGMALLIVMALFTAVAYMGIGISGEKQARVTEVIVSAIRPQAWMDGKVAAYTVIGLFQAVIWAVTAIGVMLYFATTLPASLNPAVFGLALAFAIAGYGFYVAMFALIMATIKDLQSTSKFQAYLLFIPFIPLMFMEAAVANPDATWVRLLSLLPFFSPMLVPARFVVGGIPWWEAALAFVVLIAGFHLMRTAAGQAFRVGMLMYGKELTLPELWRWARQS